MLKMLDQPAPSFHPLFLDLEKIASPAHFVTTLAHTAHSHNLLSRTAQALQTWQNLLQQLAGLDIAGVIKLPPDSAQHWSLSLDQLLQGLCHHTDDRKIVLLLDELPYMLQRFAASGSATDALLLLDTLRAARQKYTGLRMVFAGSVGLHHVLRELRQQKLASEPVNDMPVVEIRGLEPPDARLLAQRLLDDYQIPANNPHSDTVCECIARRADYIPFYMATVVTHLTAHPRPITASTVDRVVQHLLTTDSDPWEMEHFRSRLPIYYRDSTNDANGQPVPDARIASELLDHFASVSQPQSIDQVWTAVRSRFALCDRQHLVQLLRSLALDHYLVSDSSKLYSFRFSLIRSWWQTAQGLSS
jgi:hypothetical protein